MLKTCLLLFGLGLAAPAFADGADSTSASPPAFPRPRIAAPT
jgi:hypothetical protein